MMRLDDVYHRTTIDRAGIELAIYLSALFQTGAVRVDPNLAQKVANTDGRKFDFRYYQDLPTPDDVSPATAGAGPVYTDDSDNAIPTGKITEGLQTAVKAVPAMAWAEKDVINTIGFLGDPLGAIASRVAFYWSRYFDQVALAQMLGIIADNVANDAGDMVNNIGNPVQSPDPANTISPEAIVDTLHTAGDHYEMYNTMICHSVVKSSLRKQNLIDSIPASDGRTRFDFYQGMRVVATDQVNVNTGGANPIYDTYFLAPGVLGFGQSNNNIIPSELDRDPKSGQGGGDTTLITRAQFSMHPYGFEWTDTTVTGSTQTGSGNPLWPNLANYRLAANWDRKVVNRKSVNIAVLQSNA